jgi:hypothetical protein
MDAACCAKPPDAMRRRGEAGGGLGLVGGHGMVATQLCACLEKTTGEKVGWAGWEGELGRGGPGKWASSVFFFFPLFNLSFLFL